MSQIIQTSKMYLPALYLYICIFGSLSLLPACTPSPYPPDLFFHMMVAAVFILTLITPSVVTLKPMLLPKTILLMTLILASKD